MRAIKNQLTDLELSSAYRNSLLNKKVYQMRIYIKLTLRESDSSNLNMVRINKLGTQIILLQNVMCFDFL